MGSLPSPPQSAIQPPPPSPPSSYQVYASFCQWQQGPNTYICNRIECYSPSNNTWSYATSIPGITDNHFLKGFAVVSLGDHVFIIGGKQCYKQRVPGLLDPDEYVDKDVKIQSSVWRYSVRSNQWFTCVPLRTPRCDFAFSVCENKIYVAGGQSDLACARGVASTEVYDPLLDIWTPLADMAIRRYMCVGGDLASSAEVYDMQARKWGLVVGMWQLDVPPNQIVEVDGKLFSCGDCLNAWKGHIEVYDGSIWNEVEGSPQALKGSPISTSEANHEDWQPNQRLYLTMAPIGSCLYLLAGCRRAGDSSRTTSKVHIFDTSAATDAWRSLEQLSQTNRRD
ncbi:hypothetical protein FH972_000386 [Carpinus fangiana]|uniref:Uncharacterized protein n=1 Tax=Carpinus fangiana TaxID=176857 RepID=A0A5N6QBL3_9ROSI|nr:hypothetical protein FH972_000386 [Carpinus fangiana]